MDKDEEEKGKINCKNGSETCEARRVNVCKMLNYVDENSRPTKREDLCIKFGKSSRKCLEVEMSRIVGNMGQVQTVDRGVILHWSQLAMVLELKYVESFGRPMW